ncbi:Holliday junction DNA helicase RuvA [candidate division Kazan bacterium RBG_13_50_9]|uniref:Holliday junction branch migration complex subunit RuvA n=1 Tax=candidate division Kazan bacterium RBG_13_50_9 TaxID=1798535 RepID=A0A1F4NRX2_UNCK3|nr:MAG: Holliday junction DNA helicase RuvA [candidate division Kazan bacterium RBG_13_50_9]
MIASVVGKVIAKGSDYLVVEAGGIGYKVFVVSDVTAQTSVGDAIKLLTHMAVREDSQSLYGFLTAEELELFSMLISISGIGPRVALAILSAGRPTDLKVAISRGDSAIFTTISGVGSKTAQRVILELQSKIGVAAVDGSSQDSEDIINALSGLGYNMYEIRKIIGKLSPQASLENKIKEALKLLG